MWKKYKKRIASVVILIVLVIAIELVLGFLLKPWSLADELAFDLQDLKDSGEQVTSIVLGDSTSRSIIDPRIVDDVREADSLTINASFNGQLLTSEKYNMLDWLEREPIDTVVIAIEYYQLRNEGTHFVEGYVMERIKSPKVYLQAIQEMFGFDKLQYTLYSYRYRNKYKMIPETLHMKLRSKEQKLAEKQSFRGYYPSDEGRADGGAEIYTFEMSKDEVSEKLLVSLEEMIQICKERGINVYLIGMPYAGSSLVNSLDTFKEMYGIVTEIADRNEITFYDFNLMKNRQELLENSEVVSLEHLSEEATPEVSELLAKVINAEESGQDAGQYFYHDYDEARNELKGVVGMHVTLEQGEDGRRAEVEVVTAHDELVEIQYCLETGDEMVVIQDYSGSVICDIPEDLVSENTSLVVNVRSEHNTMTRRESL